MSPHNYTIHRFLILFLLFGFLCACEKDKGNGTDLYSFSGKAQKGPYINGTTITVNELNTLLGQTGSSYTTSVTSDDGSFSLDNIELNSDLVLLTANGFYFSEIYGEMSSAQLSLQAIAKLSDKKTVNINVLTHLIKGRIEILVSEGSSFKEARDQATSELLEFLGVSETFEADFEDLDISNSGSQHAPLLGFSIILQRFTQNLNEKPLVVAELTQLLSDLSSDFSDNGIVDQQRIIDKLLSNISRLNLIDTRSYIENRLESLGQPTTIPDFENAIAQFRLKHDPNIYTDFYYPDSASPMPESAPDAKLINLLTLEDSVFQANQPYSIAAITPLNSTLTIKFISDNSKHNYAIGGPAYGWEFINEYPDGFTLNSQRQNDLMTMLIHCDTVGNGIIEYYENQMSSPTFVKNVRWE